MRLIITGGVGVGKTTFVRMLSEDTQLPVFANTRHSKDINGLMPELRQEYLAQLALGNLARTLGLECILERTPVDFMYWTYYRRCPESMLKEVINSTVKPFFSEDDLFVITPYADSEFYKYFRSDFDQDPIRWTWLEERFGAGVPGFPDPLHQFTSDYVRFSVDFAASAGLRYVYAHVTDDPVNWRSTWQNHYLHCIRAALTGH